MTDKPLVSVVIPAYNGEKTVGKTVFSIVVQNYTSLELILVDDNSKDKTVEVVKDIVDNGFFGRFDLVKHDVNLGLSKTLNDGLRKTSGDFVLILHQDCELVGDDWIEKALTFMKDEQVAVVTGYYGLPDRDDETFVKRAFGVLRKQFHTRPRVSWEEVPFSEGKCDLYRKSLLLKIGGFPTIYRIAGEDLFVSYMLRYMGYNIIKCYDLPVVQRFSGTAESFWGNLGKEFLFGKTMGRIISEFKFFPFKRLSSSGYARSRSLNRATQPFFVLASLFSFGLFLLLHYYFWFFLLMALFVIRYCYHFFRILNELKFICYKNSNFVINSLGIPAIGILSDVFYGMGFWIGFIVDTLKKLRCRFLKLTIKRIWKLQNIAGW